MVERRISYLSVSLSYNQLKHILDESQIAKIELTLFLSKLFSEQRIKPLKEHTLVLQKLANLSRASSSERCDLMDLTWPTIMNNLMAS